ncbi:unnamed protein product [Larinioides sclopetarius]|uniref:Glycine-rich protein n=1 Tax=Larinioides sclopetarius TaxID=280406 RepID=A0AAV1ZTK6_9ARAC
MTLLRQTFYEVMTIATLMAFFTPCKASEPQVAMDLLTGGIGGILGNRGDGVGGQKQEDGIWINQWVDGFLGENGLIGGQDRGQERVESIGGFLGR